MDGILIIDKPVGMTSHDVVNALRRILKTKKIGHTGTLDPFATGALVMLVGKATRLAQFIDKDEKEYEAVIRFGFETDTGDVTGMRNAECGLRNEELVQQLARVDWEEILSRFRGEIEQTPPMYSAKKVGGKKLYEHARKGIALEREPIKVTISKLEILSETNGSTLSVSRQVGIAGGLTEECETLKIRVVCSAGTYIRTLAEDIGRMVGTGGHLAELRRTRAGRFEIVEANTLERLEKEDAPEKYLLRISEAVSHLPEFVLSSERIEKTQKGLATRVERPELKDGDSVKMSDSNGNIVAIGCYNATERSIKPKIVLV